MADAKGARNLSFLAGGRKTENSDHIFCASNLIERIRHNVFRPQIGFSWLAKRGRESSRRRDADASAPEERAPRNSVPTRPAPLAASPNGRVPLLRFCVPTLSHSRRSVVVGVAWNMALLRS